VICSTRVTSALYLIACIYWTLRDLIACRVCTDPGNVLEVLEFNVEIFKALKSLENDHRYGKVWKNP